MGIQPSASNTDLLLECRKPFDPAWVYEKRPVGEAARYGTAFHAVLAQLLTFGAPSNLTSALDENGLSRKIGPELNTHVAIAHTVLKKWLAGDNVWQTSARESELSSMLIHAVEKAYAFDRKTFVVRQIESPDVETHVYPDLKATEMAGTLDLLAVSDYRGPVVVDFKTGRFGDFSSPSRIGQMKTLALMTGARRLAILDSPRERPAMTTMYSDEIDEIDVERHRNRLAKALKQIGDGAFRPGAWCDRCPARDACPTQDAALVESSRVLLSEVTGHAITLEKTAGLATPADVGRLHFLLTEYDRLAKRAKEAVRHRVRELGPGAVIRPQDGAVLAFITREVERLSKKSIVEALGKVEGEKLLEKLRKSGALKSEPQEELRAVKE